MSKLIVATTCYCAQGERFGAVAQAYREVLGECGFSRIRRWGARVQIKRNQNASADMLRRAGWRGHFPPSEGFSATTFELTSKDRSVDCIEQVVQGAAEADPHFALIEVDHSTQLKRGKNHDFRVAWEWPYRDEARFRASCRTHVDHAALLQVTTRAQRARLFKELLTIPARCSACCAGFGGVEESSSVAEGAFYKEASTTYPVGWNQFVNRVLWKHPKRDAYAPRGLFWANVFYLPEKARADAARYCGEFNQLHREYREEERGHAEMVNDACMFVSLCPDPLETIGHDLAVASARLEPAIRWTARFMRRVWPGAPWVC